MDTRQRRTRGLLRAAVLQLATARPITDITVSAIASAAGVHRSTFYEHASSPQDLLQRALESELDELRERYLCDVPPDRIARAVTDVTDAVLRHVETYAEIYRRGLGAGSGSGSLQPMLSHHFEQSTRLLVQQGSLTMPIDPGAVSADTARDTVIRFVADGTVGALDVWLDQRAPRDASAFLALYAQIVPSWWPLLPADAAAAA